MSLEKKIFANIFGMLFLKWMAIFLITKMLERWIESQEKHGQ